MEDYLLSREELIAESGVSAEQLAELEKAKLFSPAGRTASGTHVYSREDLAELPKIQVLLEVGYSFAEIRKIRKKVGIPNVGKKKAHKKVTYLTVGELAEKAQVSPRTIKYWEEKGIFEAQTRSEGGFRLYPQGFVLFCRLIKDLQNFGYRLEEIRKVADMFRDFYLISQDITHFPKGSALTRLSAMDEKVNELKARMSELKSGIKRWEQYTSEKQKEIHRLMAKLKKSDGKSKKEKAAPAADMTAVPEKS